MSLRLMLALLFGVAVVVLAAGLWSGLLWPGVWLAALAVLLALAIAWVEHMTAQRRAVILEAWEDRLSALEAQQVRLRDDVDTLNREKALGRM